MSSKNILIINTFAEGGAGTAALRQAQAISENTNLRVRVLCLEVGDDATLDSINDSAINYERIGIKISHREYAAVFNSISRLINRTDISNTFYQFLPSFLGHDKILVKEIINSDVIVFHWCNMLVSLDSLRIASLLDKRFFIFCHDMHWFTGGCHYTSGCRDFESGCNTCPQIHSDSVYKSNIYFEEKFNSLSLMSPEWLFPSTWLKEEFEKSQLKLAKTKTHILNNAIPCSEYQPSLQKRSNVWLSKNISSIPENSVVICLGADGVREIRKGINLAIEAIKQILQDQEDIHFVIFGGGTDDIFQKFQDHSRIHCVGKLNLADLKELLDESDAIIFPSLQENFSNILVESRLLCVPAFLFKIGGNIEIYTEEEGFYCESKTSTNLAKVIKEYAKKYRLSERRGHLYKTRERLSDCVNYESFAKNFLQIVNTKPVRSLSREKKNFNNVLSPCKWSSIYVNHFLKNTHDSHYPHTPQLTLSTNQSAFISRYSVNRNQVSGVIHSYFESSVSSIVVAAVTEVNYLQDQKLFSIYCPRGKKYDSNMFSFKSIKHKGCYIAIISDLSKKLIGSCLLDLKNCSPNADVSKFQFAGILPERNYEPKDAAEMMSLISNSSLSDSSIFKTDKFQRIWPSNDFLRRI